ncbi:MAG: 3-ketoacyl-ACP reductase FabG2 [Gammaproteobacteria bacterium]|nr:3-ketoacyl-ACP reductase FabG2 [Gammaproteobacteria bacterium]
MSRRVLVTGASKGIGRATAIRLASDGFQVLIHYANDRTGAEETLEQVRVAGGTGDIVQFDVRDRKATSDALEQEIEKMGPFYGVICNAGICDDAAFPALDGDAWDSVIHTNLDGFYNVLHPCVMPMIRARSGGRIITLSSVSGLVGNRGQVNYSAAKAGIIGATKALALELASRRITVNCVAPGLIDTSMLDGLEVDMALKMIPAKRLGQPAEVSAAIAFLMSDEAAYITRQVLSVNGGMV